jgi:hypothetical protein
MSQSPQLGYGARQLIDYLLADLDYADSITDDIEVKKAIHKARVRITTDLEDMLRRRGPGEPTQEARIKTLEKKVKELDGIVSAYMQSTLQHM